MYVRDERVCIPMYVCACVCAYVHACVHVCLLRCLNVRVSVLIVRCMHEYVRIPVQRYRPEKLNFHSLGQRHDTA